MGAERQAGLEPGKVLRLFVGAFVDELARSGVSQVCLCPGSRSTPLALLLKRHPAIKVWTHLDERSAAFFALGMAKARREPVAIVSTSGTAAVNFAPAVVEAYYARVPLLVLTADRPPELRDVGAPQTIDQIRLYGPHVRWFIEVPLPEASVEAIRYVRTLACRATATARSDPPGPVHLNFPFREPLVPVEDEEPPPAADVGLPLSISQQPYVSVAQAPRRPPPAQLAQLATSLGAVRRGLIVCGPQDDPEFPAAVAQLAEELDFPILADPLSQVRCGRHHCRRVIDSYDAFLRNEAIAQRLVPEVVLRFGATPTSRALMLYLQRHGHCRQLLVDDGDGWNDPGLIGSDVLHVHPRSLCEALLAALRSSTGPPADGRDWGWMGQWEALARQARAALEARLDAAAGLSEPGVFRELAHLLPAGATLFVGNSMPVRDLDSFFPGNDQPIRFMANRGASGIDGVVSSALGASTAGAGPLVLAIGDLSFYHDMNGLLAAKQHHLQATIVLLHNDGGGIFSFLPQADDLEHFEELFGTPHGLDFRHAAAMYGLAYHRVGGWEEFRTAVRAALEGPGVAVVEVRTDRRANAEFHRHIWDAVSRVVSQVGT
ncbi:MAG: 2-succinyl-5-enolpyruvyl-6-hydroxy-3-cyclohexene-1-carboxylic-acid synthase [Dehalococcoidia bacterium]